jgi:hypothetical protein
MEESKVSLIIAILALLTALFAMLQKSKAPVEKTADENFLTKPLRLQAYERLVLLCERISLPSLISRLNLPGISAREMQMLLIESIKQEYEYNISQQVYVSTLSWDAVRNLRDQSMLIINQIANVLPPDARASDLNKQLLEVIMNHQEKALHTIVLDTLNEEAKLLMK